MDNSTETAKGPHPHSVGTASNRAQLRAAFEDQSRCGSRPSIEEFLAQAPPPGRTELLTDLIAIEVARRQRDGEAPSLKEYTDRFPEHAPNIHSRLTSLFTSGELSLEETKIWPQIPATAAAKPADVPEKLGRYLLEELVGQGGFAQVWRARDPKLNRTVAVKILRPDRLPSQETLEHALGEARRVAHMQDIPGIVPIYDIGEEGGLWYIVTQFVDGCSLAELMNSESIPPNEAARLIAAAADSLHEAHKRNIVHRDVKPSNILLDGRRRVFVVDFGLAASEEEQLDEMATVLGTIAYMSPEQASGNSHRTDARTDVYSLGVILYQLLTGRLPFVAKSAMEYREQLLHREPRPLRTIDDTISPELERICLKCLAADVKERFTTAADLASGLRRAVNDRSSRNRTLAYVAAGLLLVAGVVVTLLLPAFQKPADEAAAADGAGTASADDTGTGKSDGRHNRTNGTEQPADNTGTADGADAAAELRLGPGLTVGPPLVRIDLDYRVVDAGGGRRRVRVTQARLEEAYLPLQAAGRSADEFRLTASIDKQPLDRVGLFFGYKSGESWRSCHVICLRRRGAAYLLERFEVYSSVEANSHASRATSPVRVEDIYRPITLSIQVKGDRLVGVWVDGKERPALVDGVQSETDAAGLCGLYTESTVDFADIRIDYLSRESTPD